MVAVAVAEAEAALAPSTADTRGAAWLLLLVLLLQLLLLVLLLQLLLLVLLQHVRPTPWGAPQAVSPAKRAAFLSLLPPLLLSLLPLPPQGQLQRQVRLLHAAVVAALAAVAGAYQRRPARYGAGAGRPPTPRWWPRSDTRSPATSQPAPR